MALACGLTAVDDAIFTDIAAHVTMDELLEAGLLDARLPRSPPQPGMDATGVRTVGGDYVVSELARHRQAGIGGDGMCEAVRLAADDTSGSSIASLSSTPSMWR